jgi:hypothetical protein
MFLLIATTAFASDLFKSSKELSGPAKNYELKYNLTKNSKFTLTVETTGNQIIEQCGENVEAKINSKGKYFFNVLGIDNEGNMKVGVEYKDRSFLLDHPMGPLKTDYSPLLGYKVNFLISPRGYTSGFEGFNDLPPINRELKGVMTKDDHIKTFKNMFPVLPGISKEIGDSWTENTTIEVDNEEKNITSTYTLLDEIKTNGYDCLKIKIQKDIKESGISEQNGMEIERELEGEGESILFFAYKEGIIIKIEDLTSLEGVIRAGDKTIPISTESSTKTVVNFGTIQ